MKKKDLLGDMTIVHLWRGRLGYGTGKMGVGGWLPTWAKHAIVIGWNRCMCFFDGHEGHNIIEAGPNACVNCSKPLPHKGAPR